MKKIFSSFLLIALVIASVSLSAYALFSSTANVGGLTFSTGNADLQISSVGTTWANTLSLDSAYTNMAVGFSNAQTFYLKNNSLSNIGLNIFAKIIDNNPDNNASSWGFIGNKIKVAFQKYNGNNWTDLSSNTLSDWKNPSSNLDTLSVGSTQKYQIIVTLDSADNSDVGKSLSDLSFQFTGTQI